MFAEEQPSLLVYRDKNDYTEINEKTIAARIAALMTLSASFYIKHANPSRKKCWHLYISGLNKRK